MDIELRDVRKRFDAHEVLSGIDLAVPAGARVALVGPNGSGKSTLLRGVMGLIRCDGVVRVGGRSPFTERHEVARRLAYVPQIAPQLGASVRDVIRAVSTLRTLEAARVEVIAKKLGLELAPSMEKPFRALSGGMKQKLLLSIAFATDATLFVLDEPTASLDPAARERFIELVRGLDPKVTVLFCSHRSDDLTSLVDRIIELGEGKIVRDLAVVREAPSKKPEGKERKA